MNETIMELVKLGVDQINKVPVTNFSSKDRNDAIRDKFNELMGTTKFNIMAYNQHKYEIFAILKEVLEQTRTTDEEGIMSRFYDTLVEESYIGEGDAKEYVIENEAYLTVAKITGNNWDLDRQRADQGEVVRVKTNAYYIKVFEYFKRFMSGRMDFADLSVAVDRSVRKFKNDLVGQTLVKALSGLPSGFNYAGAYIQESVQEVLTNVSAANEGVDVLLVGTKGALNKLQNISVAGLSDAQKEEYNNSGFIRQWNGYLCVELPTAFKANSITEFLFDNSTIYALPAGAKPIKVVNEGEVLVAETDDISSTTDMTKNFAVIWKIGAVAIFNRLIGQIKITE